MALELNQDYNIGSLSQVWLALAYQVASVNPVVFKDVAFTWLVVDMLPESGQCEESSDIVDAGDEYTYSLVFAVNMLNEDMLATVKQYIGQFAIVQYTDSNGLTRLLGSPDNPATVKIKTDTGKNYSDMNGLVLSVSWLNSRASVSV